MYSIRRLDTYLLDVHTIRCLDFWKFLGDCFDQIHSWWRYRRGNAHVVRHRVDVQKEQANGKREQEERSNIGVKGAKSSCRAR